MTIITTLSAQTGLYEAIEQNGTEAEYMEFYHISKGEEEGTTKVSGEAGYWVKARIVVAENGARTGFSLINLEGNEKYGFSLLYRSNEAMGYPNVSYIRSDDDGTIVVGDYIMDLEGISADRTSFESIDRVFVKKQVKVKKEASKDTGEKKKGSKFLAGLKSVAQQAVSSDSGSGSNSLEAKKARSEDLFQIATDYLIAMKAKQNAYTLTSNDKADIQKVKTLVDQKYKKINKANADYWNSEAGQHVLQREKENSISFYNANWATIWIVNEDGGTGFVKEKMTFEFDCSVRWYYSIGSDHTKGSFIGGGDDSYCQKTITINDQK